MSAASANTSSIPHPAPSPIVLCYHAATIFLHVVTTIVAAWCGGCGGGSYIITIIDSVCDGRGVNSVTVACNSDRNRVDGPGIEVIMMIAVMDMVEALVAVVEGY